MNEIKNILVTGGGGYIGTTLVPHLVSKGYRVKVVDRFFFGHDLLPEEKSVELIQEDVRWLTEEHFAGIDAVIDLAALSNDPSGELFQDVTWDVNHKARAAAARMAKAAGVKRYILPSSASIYGFQDPEVFIDEDHPTNPLTTYAKANEKAEEDILPLADDDYCVIVLRLSTVYGYSPRMRLDLAINGMTYGALSTGKLPLMRDGTQWRPMVHVRDVAAAMEMMLQYDSGEVNGEIFNVGSERNNYQIKPLAERVVAALPRPVEIEWYGDPDHRSYRIAFNKIEALGYQAKYAVEDGVKEICEAIEDGRINKDAPNITLQHYKDLEHWFQVIKDMERHGGILHIEDRAE